MKSKRIYFLESDFGLDIKNKVLFEPSYKSQITFPKRILTDAVYFVRFLFVPRKSIVVAPWGLFWIPALWNKFAFKNYKIISLTCDTFLSEKTIKERKQSILKFLKYVLAKKTYEEVRCFIYCSQVVKEQLLKFGVPEEKLIFKYQEWNRFDRGFEKIRPNLSSNNFLFVGHHYNIMQKRADILVEAYLQLRKEFPDIHLIIVGRDWKQFFEKKYKENIKKYGIEFAGGNYDISGFMRKSAFYVHPGEFEGFGLSVLEGMLSGLIPLVSNLTGSKEMVEKLDRKLVVKLSADDFYTSMKALVKMPLKKRNELSRKARDITRDYTMENSLKDLNFRIKELIKRIERG
jgi:glycosyltransferase involved in cell wall biosynthesis